MKSNLCSLPVGLLTLLADVVFAALPFNPSQVFVPSQHNGSLVYVLIPESSTSNQFQLLSFDASSTLTTSDPQYTVLSESLPFLTEDEPKAFTPTVDENGVLTFYTGDCTQETEPGEVWYYSPSEDGETENGTWAQWSLRLSDGTEVDSIQQGNFLAPGIVYSADSESSRPSLYIFGGMCPETTEGEDDDWVSGANYSQTLLILEPDESSDTDYQLSVAESNEPPVAEAGFTITPLLATYSNPAADQQVQQQNFVLIGGHTQQAFVGTSRVALLSLPETTWSYVPVNQPDGGTKSDLTRREATEVQPRSGHTAVLSPDGSKIIVLGGWVGDTSVPAEPQLVVLEVGEDYGGSGDWSWTVPNQLGPGAGLAEGTGIFGHGAAILPGDIMLVAGGYNIPAPSSSKRATSEPALNTGSYMFNISSNEWVTSYNSPEGNPETNPGTVPSDSEPESSGPLSSPSQKAGLGAGLGIGLSAAVILVGFLLYSRRSRSHQKEREQALRDLALGAERPHFGPPEMSSDFGGAATLFRQGGSNSVPDSPYAWIGNGGSEAERTGLLVEIPSPTRGLRRNLYPRGYQPASQFDGRRNRASTYIHPIDEQDEDEETTGEGLGELAQKVAQRGSKNSIPSDPFMDPIPLDDQPGDGQLGWHGIDEPGNATLRPTSKGRSISPDKSERTLSNLSDLSSVSRISPPRSNFGSLKRSASQKSSHRSYHSPTPSSDRPSISPDGKHHTDYIRNKSSGADGKETAGKPYADSFSTAHSSFPQLQAEGEMLLGGGPEWSTPPESPEKPASTTPKNKALGWVRRAIASAKAGDVSDRSISVSPETATTCDQRSVTSSPTKSHHNPFDDVHGTGEPLSRSISTNTAALRRKQGAKDWGAEKRMSGASSIGAIGAWEHGAGGSVGLASIGGFSSHGDDGDDGEEWDVEAAAEGRLVQVTYTVPKERLRVVNAGADDDVEDEDAEQRVRLTRE